MPVFTIFFPFHLTAKTRYTFFRKIAQPGLRLLGILEFSNVHTWGGMNMLTAQPVQFLLPRKLISTTTIFFLPKQFGWKMLVFPPFCRNVCCEPNYFRCCFAAGWVRKAWVCNSWVMFSICICCMLFHLFFFASLAKENCYQDDNGSNSVWANVDCLKSWNRAVKFEC